MWRELQLDWTKHTEREVKIGLTELMGTAWFRRVWISQEVANATEAIVCAGDNVASSHIFAAAPIMRDIKPSPLCQAVLDNMPCPLRNVTWWSLQPDLLTLLRKFGNSEASDPRDNIYALLGISSDGVKALVLQPGYTKLARQLVHVASTLISGSIAEAPSPFPDMTSLLRSTMYLPYAIIDMIAETDSVVQ
ncbi:uncharacterized protein CC84DRAFT_534035 [Paraphaeosphaeria sporulosa]|uniref:Heterokaryon incompatibility domain-containing protein n=1 Tax=Paraphaeosphaeria sporulosa TaxID=1460663 RepID=A0A177CM60_9PLEO|nr:uncharacterized protein CC84DRAFT_534035 [Paraphaeosphaeria sporulosa]OAG08032.1 hypothetical protein CC84DRAFT_534035 [Paraphaeosphaeria sporulosa]